MTRKDVIKSRKKSLDSWWYVTTAIFRFQKTRLTYFQQGWETALELGQPQHKPVFRFQKYLLELVIIV